jgi:hypothetical protein
LVGTNYSGHWVLWQSKVGTWGSDESNLPGVRMKPVGCFPVYHEGGMDGWMDGWINSWLSGWMDEWINGWLSGWMNELMVG